MYFGEFQKEKEDCKEFFYRPLGIAHNKNNISKHIIKAVSFERVEIEQAMWFVFRWENLRKVWNKEIQKTNTTAYYSKWSTILRLHIT